MSYDNHLTHYASKYYDPEKAHEYYISTRQLKGRRPSSKLSDEGKEIWSYTKENISVEKKNKVETEKTTRDKKIEELRARASETRERISARLNELNEALTKNAVNEKAKISSDKESKIKQLMAKKIPEGISKEKRAELIAKRKEKIAKIRSYASSDTSEVNEETKQNRSKNYNDAADQRKQVATELKTCIAAAREAYKAVKTSLDSSYEEIYQREYDNIADKYAKPIKKKKSNK